MRRNGSILRARVVGPSRPAYLERHRGFTCEVCNRPTRKGKPYCLDHLDHSPYVAKVMAWAKRNHGKRAS